MILSTFFPSVLNFSLWLLHSCLQLSWLDKAWANLWMSIILKGDFLAWLGEIWKEDSRDGEAVVRRPQAAGSLEHPNVIALFYSPQPARCVHQAGQWTEGNQGWDGLRKSGTYNQSLKICKKKNYLDVICSHRTQFLDKNKKKQCKTGALKFIFAEENAGRAVNI